MKLGDEVMIYHSVGPKELVGLATITKEAFKDKGAYEGDWVAVGVSFKRGFSKPLKLATLKEDARLQELSLVKQSRLSVCPVSKKQWQILLELTE